MVDMWHHKFYISEYFKIDTINLTCQTLISSFLHWKRVVLNKESHLNVSQVSEKTLSGGAWVSALLLP